MCVFFILYRDRQTGTTVCGQISDPWLGKGGLFRPLVKRRHSGGTTGVLAWRGIYEVPISRLKLTIQDKLESAFYPNAVALLIRRIRIVATELKSTLCTWCIHKISMAPLRPDQLGMHSPAASLSLNLHPSLWVAIISKLPCDRRAALFLWCSICRSNLHWPHCCAVRTQVVTTYPFIDRNE